MKMTLVPHSFGNGSLLCGDLYQMHAMFDVRNGLIFLIEYKPSMKIAILNHAKEIRTNERHYTPKEFAKEFG
jgi:hypothetical protein